MLASAVFVTSSVCTLKTDGADESHEEKKDQLLYIVIIVMDTLVGLEGPLVVGALRKYPACSSTSHAPWRG